MEKLKERWVEIFSLLGWGPKISVPLFEQLVKRYQEPHRAYHTLSHIEFCFKEFDAIPSSIVRVNAQTAVELAIFYHDTVYDVKAHDNEENSGELARKDLKPLSMSGMASYVVDLILATKHTSIPSKKGADILVDIDLAILGQPEAAFDEYERQIRQEYAWVPEEIYRVERAKILKSFLDRPTIYCTEYFQKKYEAQARANLARSIARLQG